MSLIEKMRNVSRGLLQAYGSESIKRYLWNTEFFSHSPWEFITDNTKTDFMYQYLIKYLRVGSILDLGCGAGNTGSEMEMADYQQYTGVDISDATIAYARKRSEEAGRGAKNHYFQSDILSYRPTGQFDVILFRESLYYVPQSAVYATLDRYSKYLNAGGIFIVRVHNETNKRIMRIAQIINTNFEVIECVSDPSGAGILCFRQTALRATLFPLQPEMERAFNS
jgi:SAM-dependent methyltransferase